VTARSATLRGTALVTAGQLALAAAGFLAALLLARELGPVAYGVWGIVYAILVGVEQIGRLGIPQATSRLVAEADGRDPLLERRAVTLMVLVFAALGLALWLAAPWLARVFAIPDGTRLLRIASLDVLPFGLLAVTVAIVNGRRDFLAEGLANLVYAGTRIVGLLLVAPFGLTIEAALVVTILSSLAGCLATLARLGPSVLRPRLDGFRPLLRVAAPVAVAWAAAGLLSNLDLWALNAFGAAVAGEVKGWYTAALNLARLPNLLAFVATSILVPTIARALGAGDRAAALATLRSGTTVLLALLVPMLAVGTIEARGLLELVFSEAYGGGAPLLAILLAAHGVLYTGFVTLGSVLLAAGRERISALIAPAAAAAALLFLPLGTVLAGAVGTALGALATGLVACGAASWAVRRLVGPLLDLAALARILLATAVLGAILLVLPGRGFWLLGELALAGIAYLALLVASGVAGPALGLPHRFRPTGASPAPAPAAPMDARPPSV
jgi:O-antigen/teichoic acid export membrane protein